jgi:hypothetical protein
VQNVGGSTLVEAWTTLAPGGVLQSIGWTSGEPAVLPVYGTVGPAKSLVSFQAGIGFGADLSIITTLAGKLPSAPPSDSAPMALTRVSRVACRRTYRGGPRGAGATLWTLYALEAP